MKLYFKVSKVRRKASRLGVQSKLIWFLELYISGSTNSRKVETSLDRTSEKENVSKSITAAQKIKKKLLADFFIFFFIFECLWTQKPTNQLIKAFNSYDSSRPYHGLLENPKIGGSRELLLPENNFKTYSAVNFCKKTSRFWRPGNQPKTWNSDLILFHRSYYIWNQYNIKIVLGN